MANVQNGNTFFIDTQYSAASDELQIKNIRLAYLVVSSTAATNQLTLSDSITGVKKLTIFNINSNGGAGDSRIFDFQDYPVQFPNGIRPTTLTNCVATCIYVNPTG